MVLNSKAIVAYFDFDGTLTTKDTLLPFLLHTVGIWRFLRAVPRLVPILLLYGLKIISNERAKEQTCIALLRGMTKSTLEIKARRFALEKLDKWINPKVYSRLEYHLEHGHQVVLVSANLAIYLMLWAKKHNLHAVIATDLEFINDKCTGKLATRNCYGPQKVLRIQEYLQNMGKEFDYSYGYGNSKGDYELLKLVNEAYWVSDGEISSWNRNL